MIKLKYPLKYIAITSGYKSKSRPNHAAIDLGWNKKYGGQNTPVYAPANGKVISVVNGKYNNTKKSTDPGNLIKIQHLDGLTTRLIHLKKDSIKVKVGDIVTKGQQLALMNSSGYAFGSHLHYDVWLNGIKVNPIDYNYYNDDQIVNSETLKTYNLKKDNKEEPEDLKFHLYDKVIPIKLVNWQGKKLKQLDKVYYITKLELERKTVVLSALRNNKYHIWARLYINNIKKTS